jgi:pyruvate formate-lyase/glycerol dehydratase family glycyl radical enzyme
MAEIPKPGSISFEDRVNKSTPFEWGFGSTPRIAKLRNDLYWKAAVTKEWYNVAMGLGKCTFREGQGVRMDVDRARIITKSYKETDGQPWVMRKAMAVKKLCEETPIFIKPGELIVGDPNSAPDEVRWYPETAVWWMPDAVTSGGFSEMVDDAQRKEIVEEICEYWNGRNVRDRILASLPEDMVPIIMGGLDTPVTLNVWEESRTVANYEYESLFKEGLKARVERAEANLKNLEDQIAEMNPGEYLEKKNNWEAMAICGKAIIHFAKRYERLAKELAKAETNDTRKEELEKIATILEWVPANPPRTFHEALQFFWIVDVVGHFMAVCGNGCGARIDQVWWPYYEADMKADRITRDKALELVECLFLKIQDLGSPPEWPLSFSVTSGFDVGYTPNICGSDSRGQDASNDLSCIIMEAMVNCHLTQPPIAVRYHRNISPDVIDRAIDLLRTGQGHPSFFNEDLLEKWGLMLGYSPEDARKTQVSACVANHIPGKSLDATGLIEVGIVFSIRLLEEILGLYVPEVSGGPKTKDVVEMNSAHEIFDAFCERLLYYSKIAAITWNIAQQVITEYNPDPCNSFLLNEPLERGLDLNKLHKEDNTWPNFVNFGRQNLADSLAAIQKLVFDEKKYTMEELLKSLKANWEGCEEMRQDFLNAPKYGNDDDYADEWAVKVAVGMEDTVKQVKDAWGYPLTFDGSTVAGYQAAGLPCGASPDGRMASSFLADGTLSPMTGVDKIGPTAVLNSASKIPYLGTQLFNQRFMPQFLEGENKMIFAEYLREWHEKGTIPHIQFNVIDSNVLREAQKHPEDYTDLQVRVAGYSAFWVDLSGEVQETILARTEQCI